MPLFLLEAVTYREALPNGGEATSPSATAAGSKRRRGTKGGEGANPKAARRGRGRRQLDLEADDAGGTAAEGGGGGTMMPPAQNYVGRSIRIGGEEATLRFHEGQYFATFTDGRDDVVMDEILQAAFQT